MESDVGLLGLWGAGSATRKVQETSCTFPFLLHLPWFLSPAATLSDLCEKHIFFGPSLPHLTRKHTLWFPYLSLHGGCDRLSDFHIDRVQPCFWFLVLSTDGKRPADALAADQETR